MNQIDTNTLITICTCAIGLTQFFLWRYIARNKSYESEKGKNLATKEDIKDITQKIESVKDNYNKALENYKIELQKEFESYKYISDLCNNIDKELLQRLITCKNDIADVFNDITNNSVVDGSSINSIRQLYEYLEIYNMRYGDNECVKNIISKSNSIYQNYINNQDGYNFNDRAYFEKIQDIEKYSTLILSHFLPKINFPDSIKPA